MAATSVVVTGGAGFIGSHVADALLARGATVRVVDDLSAGSRANLNPEAEFLQADIRSPEASGWMAEARPDAIIHLAAQMSVSFSVREPVVDAGVNVMGSLTVLETARRVGARVVFASTGGAIYGDADLLPTPESSPAWPVSPYGVAKLAVERYLHSYQVQYGLSSAALRLANVYGPRQTPHGEAGVIAIFAQALFSGRQTTIHGDGRYFRDYVYVSDVVDAVLLALDSTEAGVFNVGTGRQVDVNEIHSRLVSLSGVAAEPVHGPDRPGDVRRSAVDCSLIGERLGWQPHVGLEQGLQRTTEWFRQAVNPSP